MALCTYRVDSCLGCIPLQRGAIIIGFLNLCGSLLETIRYMSVLVVFEVRLKLCEEAKPRQAPGYLHDTLRDDPRSCPTGRMLASERSSKVIPIFILFIYFILTALMIHGVRRERPNLIAPWLWWQLSLLAVGLLGIIGLQSLQGFLIKMIVLLMAMYLFMVVNSYYLKLLQQERNPSRVTVIAMAPRRSEMTVSFPSPLKDDPPPPYHSCYIPAEAPCPPPYDTTVTIRGTSPPPYQSVDPLTASTSANTQEEPHSTPTPNVSSLANSTPGSSIPTTPDPDTANSDSARDTQPRASAEESRSSPEAVGERVPLVVNLSTSQNN